MKNSNDITDIFRYLNVEYKSDMLYDINWHIDNVPTHTYDLCVAKSFIMWDNTLKTEYAKTLIKNIIDIWPHVDVRGTGYYYYLDTGIGLQPHIDRHGDHPGSYYALIFPLEGEGKINFYKEEENNLVKSYNDPFYTIYDNNEVTEIGSRLVDKPIIFNPTKIVHSLDITAGPRKIFMIRYYNAPDNIDNFVNTIEKKLNDISI